MANNEPKKLKRVVIKEELVKLTGDCLSALVLNQLLYWSERTKDFDGFIEEEITRREKGDVPSEGLSNALTAGWIYKSSKKLAEELLEIQSEDSIRRKLVYLEEQGWIASRKNPLHEWDRTWQYRPDILKIQHDLEAKGLVLEGYPLPQAAESSRNLREQSAPCGNNSQPAGAIPEITSEITIKKNRAAVGKPTDGGGLFFKTNEFLTIFDTLKKERYPDHKTTTNPKKEAALVAPILRQYASVVVLKALHRFLADSDAFIVKNGHRVEEFHSRFSHFIDDAYWKTYNTDNDHSESMARVRSIESTHQKAKDEGAAAAKAMESERARVNFGKPMGMKARLAVLTATIGRPMPREPGEEE